MELLREALTEQYRGGLAMLDECVAKCPDELWRAGIHPRTFWRIVFHAAFYAHLYLGQDEAAFAHTPWQGRREGIHAGLWENPAYVEPYELPENAPFYTRDEMRDYIRFVSSIIASTVANLDLDAAETGFPWYPNMTKLSHELMNVRHLQGHVGQLSELLMAHDIDIDWAAKR